MARIVSGPKGPQVLIEPGDSCYSIAKDVAGNAERWPELIDANPGRELTELGTFANMIPGDRLYIPLDWIEYAKSKGMPIAKEAAGLSSCEDAGAILPNGFSNDDLRIVNAMGEAWGGTGDDLLSIWFQESGIQPHIYTPFGANQADGRPVYEYAGLIEGLASVWKNGVRTYPIDQTMGWKPGTYLNIVRNQPIAVQLQAIAQIWDKTFKTWLSEPIADRANRLGVSFSALAHALNFLPARVNGLKDADQPITKVTDKDPGTKSGSFYGDNPGFDMNRDGAISLRDMDLYGEMKLASLKKSNLGALVAAADSLRSSKTSLASLWAPYTSDWENLTGKSPVTTVGYGARSKSGGFADLMVLVALFILGGVVYYKWGR